MRAFAFLFLGFLTLLTIHFNFCSGNSKSGRLCIESERQALLRFKQHLKDPSSRLASWAGDRDCCTWLGVVCNNVTGHVLELHLRWFHPLDDYYFLPDYDYEFLESSWLGGKIHHSLLDLKYLNYLDLSYNDFEGTSIPTFLGSMGSLRYLNLSNAGFGGLIPHQLGNLSNLHYLNLQVSVANKYYLNVNNLQWLSGLPLLEHLDMSSIDLSRAYYWFPAINQLPSLLELHLSHCQLYFIPPMLPTVNLSSLAILDLSYNFESYGSWTPTWVFRLSGLISLDLSGNYLQGKIHGDLQNMTLLRKLDLSYNHFDSSLPNWLYSFNHLEFLNLAGNNFQGIIHDLQNMTSLRKLDLSYNDFNSSIPNWLYCFGRLEFLNLAGTYFQGIIPVLHNMTSLRELDLSENYFNSSIPNWLYSFNHLEFLNLAGNDFHGTISSAIGNLTSAVEIDLSYNNLEGKIPRSLGNLCNLRGILFSGLKCNQEISEILKILSGCVSDGLEILYLDGAQLSGHLTDELIGQFKNLARLSLSKNSISGQLPESLGNLSSLRYLKLSNNQFNGTLPQSFGQLAKLESFGMSANMLKGVVSEVHFSNLRRLWYFSLPQSSPQNPLILKVSPYWVPPFQLKYFHVTSWYLGPKFPSWLCSQKHLLDLDISNTRLSETIPSCFWKLASQLRYLNLSHNQIPREIPNIYELPLICDLSSNHFNGSLPALSSNWNVLDLSNNFLFGSISHFLCDQKIELKYAEFLFLQGNHLSGNIPDCWMKWHGLRVLNLGNNNFTGSIPASMGSLILLESLHLQNNKLSGIIPLFLKNCTELVAIDFGENLFVGHIPSWVGQKLSGLIILNLRSNNFNGHIPEELCALTSLQILVLANNKLSGRIPRCIHNFSAMATTNNSNNYHLQYYEHNGDVELLENAKLVIKGKFGEYSTILLLVKDLDFSNNNLSGEIPKEVISLIGLQSLNLSYNLLIGSIPKNIGAMKSLESVDFSVNHLLGEIPPSMSTLTFLSHLNLSYNKLTGTIPSSTQLQSLDASSFIGNELCGPPLNDNCGLNGVKVKPNVGNGESKDGNGVEVDWFYVSMAPGFVVGFWGVWSPLLLKKRWRIAYFQFLDHMGYKLEMSWHKLGDTVSKCCKISNN